jgi:hypothetical protein
MDQEKWQLNTIMARDKRCSVSGNCFGISAFGLTSTETGKKSHPIGFQSGTLIYCNWLMEQDFC